MGDRNYSLLEIKRSYDDSEDVDFYRYSIARFFFRPLSFYGAWLFLKLGITPNQTTFLSWLMVLAGCFMYVLIPPSSSWIPVLLILGWAILDYMDGSMARVCNSRSKYGHFIDVVGAYFMLAFLPICVGISLYHYPDYSLSSLLSLLTVKYEFNNVLIVVLGAFASLNNILLRLIVLRMQNTFSVDPRKSGSKRKGYMRDVAEWIEALMSPRGLFFPILILLTALNMLELFVFIYFLFYTGALILYVGLYTYKMRNF